MPGCSSSRASCSVVLKPQSPHFDTNKGAGAAHLLGREVKELRQRALVGQARLGVAQLIEERVCARLHGGHALVCPRVPPRRVICLARAQAHTRPLAALPPCLLASLLTCLLAYAPQLRPHAPRCSRSLRRTICLPQLVAFGGVSMKCMWHAACTSAMQHLGCTGGSCSAGRSPRGWLST